METLANLEAFVRSAEANSFSRAARRLSLTPAAVSRNVGMLERNLGVRLFHRSTRKLALTEEGEAFLQSIGDSLADLQSAIDGASQIKGEPVGVLKVSMSLSFAMGYVIPALPEFLSSYPGIRPDWHFDSRQVDLIAEGFDVAIGGGFDLNPGIVAKALAPVHVVAVCAPSYFGRKVLPTSPADLAEYDGILMRFSTSGRIREWMMRNAQGDEERALLKETVVMSDSAPMIQAALAGLGIAMVAMPDALPHLESGTLIRILPKWYADAGSISLYYSGRALQPLKTRAFIDFYTEHFRRERISARFAGSLK
ncbi:DNA-binding transcriptional LysR family regulator [Sphingomonas zeicaulis]|uniref:LysR family transcriptional regulator n=1 Tax=Sphingomonas zeicaulis TaxID=1632740 RepID=UPI003D1C8963